MPGLLPGTMIWLGLGLVLVKGRVSYFDSSFYIKGGVGGACRNTH